MLLGRTFLLVVATLVLFPTPLFAKNNSSPAAISKRIPLQISAAAYSTRQKKWILQVRSDRVQKPASVIKLLTAAFSLDDLGPNAKFKSSLWAPRAKSADGRVSGNLVFLGGGDPALVTESLVLLAQKLRISGVKEIQGTLVWDDSYFPAWTNPDEKEDGQDERAYNAPVSALSLNYNALALWIRPDLSVEPETPGTHVQVIPQLRNSSNVSNSIRIDRKSTPSNRDRFEISGSIRKDSEIFQKPVSIQEPSRYAATSLCAQILASGIQIDCAKVRRRTAEDLSTVELASLESQPLSQIVTLMNKYSNNCIANTVALQWLKSKKAPDEFSTDPEKVHSSLVSEFRKESQKWGLKHTEVLTPSGLSLKTQSTTEDLVQLLKTAHQKADVWPELLVSLPIAGVDGTLKKRFKDPALSGRLRAKTGLLDGVATLAGQLKTRSGDEVLFAFFDQSNLSGKNSGLKLYDYEEDLIRSLDR